MSKYSEDLTKYLKTQHVDCENILDIGGGVELASKRVGSCKHKTYHILDNGNEHDWHDKWNEATFIEDISRKGLWEEMPIKYNVVFCLEVLEYVENVNNAIINIFNMIEKGGIAYISTCWAYPKHNPIDQDRLRISREWMKLVVFPYADILECIPRRYSEEAFKHIQQAWRIDGLRAAKHYLYHDVIGWIWKLKKT